MTWLDVSGNRLTGFLAQNDQDPVEEFDLDAVRSISLALAENDTIQHLNLRDNRSYPIPSHLISFITMHHHNTVLNLFLLD